MGERKRDVNDLIEVTFKNMNLAQMLFVQAVLVPELTAVIDSCADALVELDDLND